MAQALTPSDTNSVIEDFDPNYLDGVLALRTLIAQPATLEVYRRQIVTVRGLGTTDFIFIHGVPDTTALTSAMTVQHKRMRRALVRRQDVAIPDGATFPMGTGIPRSKRFADRLGYPVVVKPANGDPGSYVFTNVANEEDLDHAIAEIKTPIDERKGVFHSGYTPLVLGVPVIEDDRRIVPRNYRFLIEQKVPGQLVRFLVYNGKILSAVQCNGYPSNGILEDATEILSAVHPQLQQKVIDAYRAIPDLAVGAIDVVTTDPRARLRRQQYAVVDYSERPFLWVQAKASAQEASRISEEIVRDDLSRRGHQTNSVPNQVQKRIKLWGVSTPGEVDDAISRTSQESNITSTLTSWDRLDAVAEITVEGAPFEIATFINAATNDLLPNLTVQMAEILHENPSDN